MLLVVLAACGSGGGGSAEGVRESASETTTTTVAPTSTTSTTAAGGRTTTTARGATTTTAKAGAGPATTVAGAKALAPATPGTYRYDTAGAIVIAGSTVPFPAVTTLTVDAPSGTTQHSTRNLQDPSGNGLATEFTLDYRPAGVFLVGLKVTTGFSGASDIRELRPLTPVLLLATGAGPGAHRDIDLTGISTAKMTVDVVREERVTIGGQAVDTLVMQAVVTLAPGGQLTGRQELTVNLDRGSRLWVKEHSVVDASALGGLVTAHGEYTATIQRLTP